MAARRTAERGFTMIEVVVALALVTIVLAAIGSLFASNARGARSLEQHVALVETARLVATMIPRSGGLASDDLAGEVFGYRWQMRASPFLPEGLAVPDSKFIPQRIELRVRSPSGAIISLETVRLQSRGGSR
jgi:general secretion pathway protein I